MNNLLVFIQFPCLVRLELGLGSGKVLNVTSCGMFQFLWGKPYAVVCFKLELGCELEKARNTAAETSGGLRKFLEIKQEQSITSFEGIILFDL